MTDAERNMYKAIRDYIDSLIPPSQAKPDTETAISFLTRHIGTQEYDGIVADIQTWFYGHLVKAPWCATCVSYVLSHIYNYNCKYENVYHLNNWAKLTLMQVPDIANAKENDLVIISFGGPLSVTTRKHTTFYTGKRDDSGNYLCLGGNQSNSIRISAYSPSDIYAVYRPRK